MAKGNELIPRIAGSPHGSHGFLGFTHSEEHIASVLLSQRQQTKRIPIAGPGSHQRRDNADGFTHAHQCGMGIAEILNVGIALYLPQLRIGIGQIKLRLTVPMATFGCGVQVFENSRNQKVLSPSRTGQLFDRPVQLGEQAVTQLAKVGRALFGSAALLLCYIGLPCNSYHARYQGGDQQR